MQVRDNMSRIKLIIATIIALGIVTFGFFAFISMNNSRISEQNTMYLQGSTEQSARRINEWMNDSSDRIRLASSLYASTLESADDVSVDDIARLANDMRFDYITISLGDGTTVDNRGQKVDASKRDYFVQGMQGKSGVCAIDNSLFYNDLAVVFYTPLTYDGEIIGVICGAYREDSMEQYLRTYIFGEQTNTFLIETDGTVVARSTVSYRSDVKNAFDLYFSDGTSTGVSRSELEAAFQGGIATAFDYKGENDSGTAYVMPVEDCDWYIVRTFPNAITDGMQGAANFAGFVMVAMVAGALILVMVVLLVQIMRQRHRLASENEQANSIISSSLALFQRFAVIDLQRDTYEYLKDDGVEGDFPRNGGYSLFRCYWKTRFCDDAEQVGKQFSPDFIREHLTPDTSYLRFEYRIKDAKTGEEHWSQSSLLPLQRDANGVVTSVLLSVQDVTDVKKREAANRDELKKAFREAESASRAKTDFLNAMSHDIRTPMNSIMGLTAIASMHLDDSERVKDCLKKITASSRHLLNLINEVLDMAKIESGRLSFVEEDFDLPESIENLLSVMMPQIDGKGLKCKVETDAIEHEHVVGDLMRLQQVFVNIMGNSVKFTPKGGTISMFIRELSSQMEGFGCYQFIFSDTGCGMSEEFVKKVFEPFARANDSRTEEIEGTGLGMSIVRSVVNSMNGTVDVESKLGEGTTFTVTVHLKLREGDQKDCPQLEGLRALVADDDAAAAESACELLRSIGMDSSYVLSGDDAVQAVRASLESGQRFSVIILDWKMPGKNGIETAREVRRIVSDDVPIVILSAYDWTVVEQEARSVGIDAFIAKPLFRSRLVRVMRGLLDEGSDEAVSEYEALQQNDFSGHRVLLTEDNAIAAGIALEIMGMTGLEVDHAQNGRIAVERLLESDPGHYDLVFMDIQMPVMNGYESARAIRATAKGKGLDGSTIDPRPDLGKIPIVALTADAFADDVARARAAGIDAHMSKPMEIDKLVKTLNQWL